MPPAGAFETQFAVMYDEIYRDKDYEDEVKQLCTLFESYGSSPERILDVGCGTGSHAIHLAERGFDIVGIEPSTQMAERAREKAQSRTLKGSVTIETSTIEQFEADQTFDAAIAQFNVLGYVTENEQLVRAFHQIEAALEPESLVVFDTWYGPTVLTVRPETRLRKVSLEDGMLYRYATPTMDVNKNVVEVVYEILHIVDENVVEVDREVHPLRYFFRPEIELFCEKSGLELLDFHPTGDIDGEVDCETWNVTWVLES